MKLRGGCPLLDRLASRELRRSCKGIVMATSRAAFLLARPNVLLSMTFTLRPATIEDADWLFAIRRATMRDYVEQAFGFWDDTGQRERFDESDELRNMQIIMLDGYDVGLLHVERSARDIFLANIQIAAVAQNRGLGTAVIRSLMDEARRAGVPLR